MIHNLQEFNIKIRCDHVTPASLNYRPPSWPPPRDWPVVIDKHGTVVSRWGDSRWDLAPWAGKRKKLNFGDGGAGSRREAEPLDAGNADLMRMVATWLIWGSWAVGAVNTIYANFYLLRPLIALCSRNGINAANLMRFPKLLEQVPSTIRSSSYQHAVTLLHRLYDEREVLGFTIIDTAGLRRLASASPDHDNVQTPYIPPRIWLYQTMRLNECLQDFLDRREQIEACFHFCIEIYIKRFGTLEAALLSNRKGECPFHPTFSAQNNYPGKFSDVAAQFGISDTLYKWVSLYRKSPDIRTFSTYLSMVTVAGMAYVSNFTLQRKEEVASLRADCLLWDEDEKLGRVPIIRGETTKTDPNSDAYWIASPSVEVAIQALSAIAHLRMICDRVNPAIQPTAADQRNPYLASTPTEPWGNGLGTARPYNIRRITKSLGELAKRSCEFLFLPEQMTITAEDLRISRRLTPNLPEDEFSVGKVWPLAWHQYRRTGAVNMFASGDISDSTMQQQMKHSSRLMPLYYGRNHGHLHLNKEVQTAVVMAMYQAQAEKLKVVATDDKFISPHGAERKETFAIRILSVKENKDLIKMSKEGTVDFREHRLGGCMKAGACEYGGIESIARCGGGDSDKPCTDVLYDRRKEPQIRADMHRVEAEIKMLPSGHPRSTALLKERKAMENYLNAISNL